MLEHRKDTDPNKTNPNPPKLSKMFMEPKWRKKNGEEKETPTLLAFMRPSPNNTFPGELPARNAPVNRRLLLTLPTRGSIRLQILICPEGNRAPDQNDCIQPNTRAGATAGTTTGRRGRGTTGRARFWVTGL